MQIPFRNFEGFLLLLKEVHEQDRNGEYVVEASPSIDSESSMD